MSTTTKEALHPHTPSRWIRHFAPLLRPGGPVLDVAAGAGRHARLLLGLGRPVTAVDRDLSPLAPLAAAPGLDIVRTDLEEAGGLPPDRFAGVVVTNYLHRPLLPGLIEALEPGGILLYETWAHPRRGWVRVRDPRHLAGPGELPRLLGDRLEILAFQEVERPGRKAVQRLCAVRPPRSPR